MRKKLTLLLLVLLCLSSLTGCGLKKKFENAVDDVQSTYTSAKEANTKQALYDALEEGDNSISEAYEEARASAYKENAGFLTRAWNSIKVHNPFSNTTQEDVEEAYLNKHKDIKSEVLATTESTMDVQDAASVEASSMFAVVQRFIPLIVVVVVIIILLVLFLAMRRNMAETKMIRKASKKLRPRNVGLQVKTGMGDAKVNYDNVLAANCKRLGKNKEEMIAEYGGVREAAEATNLM